MTVDLTQDRLHICFLQIRVKYDINWADRVIKNHSRDNLNENSVLVATSFAMMQQKFQLNSTNEKHQYFVGENGARKFNRPRELG